MFFCGSLQNVYTVYNKNLIITILPTHITFYYWLNREQFINKNNTIKAVLNNSGLEKHP